MQSQVYPEWNYFPRNVKPPEWVEPFIAEVRAAGPRISTVKQRTGLHSDEVLQEIAPGLRQLGYAVESGRRSADRISRPVLFGPNGQATVSYKIDAFHEKDGIVVEVEAGRAAYNNAIHYDIIRASLILDAEYLVLVVPITYRITVNKKPVSKSAYNDGIDQLSALYASQRLTLPFRGVLVVGY